MSKSEMNLAEYIASLNKCGWCGRVVEGNTCEDEYGYPCNPQKDYQNQLAYEEMERERQYRESQLWWDTLRHEGGF